MSRSLFFVYPADKTDYAEGHIRFLWTIRPDSRRLRTVACQEKQYDFCLTVYFFRMTFCKVSTVSISVSIIS